MATWSSTKYIDTLSYILKHPFINIRRTFRDIWSLCVKFSLLFRENSFCLIIISIILLLLSSVIVMSSHTVILYSPCSRCLSGPWLFGLVKCLVKRWSWLRYNLAYPPSGARLASLQKNYCVDKLKNQNKPRNDNDPKRKTTPQIKMTPTMNMAPKVKIT